MRDMEEKNIWTHDCPVALEDLRILEVTHCDFAGQSKLGKIMVHAKLAERALNIFKQLFELQFPIHSIRLINEFDGDDNQSMAANNSSCFNFRKIAGTNNLSIHSYGAAIDINPVQNPYIFYLDGQKQIQPVASQEFVDRSHQRQGMLEPVVHIFESNGFSDWGGRWTSIKDYHHFQLAPKELEELTLKKCN